MLPINHYNTIRCILYIQTRSTWRVGYTPLFRLTTEPMTAASRSRPSTAETFWLLVISTKPIPQLNVRLISAVLTPPYTTSNSEYILHIITTWKISLCSQISKLSSRKIMQQNSLHATFTNNSNKSTCFFKHYITELQIKNIFLVNFKTYIENCNLLTVQSCNMHIHHMLSYVSFCSCMNVNISNLFIENNEKY